MALGGQSVSKAGTDRYVLTGERSEPWMLAYGLFLAAALAVSLCAPSRRDWIVAQTICSGAALACLLMQFVVLSEYRSHLGQHRSIYGSLHGSYTPWLYLSFVLNACSLLFCRLLLAPLKRPTAQPAATESEQCLQCGTPLPASSLICSECGWSYSESGDEV